MAKRKEPKPGEWTYTVGEVPVQLTAYERPEKKMAVYTRLWDGSRYRERKALCASIRDERGRIDPNKETAARQAVVARQRAIAAGSTIEARPAGPLTLAQGFARRLDPKQGEWPVRTRHVATVERAAEIIQRILGTATLWSDVRHAHYRTLWRAMAREHRDKGTGGFRWTEQVVGVLQSTSRWLQVEELIEPGDAQPAPRWHQALKREWEEIVGAPVLEPEKPRYTVEQSERLWAALPHADPRLRLGMEIGAELRLGQVARCRRSDLLPSPDGSDPFHAVRVHGKGKKRGAVVVLTPESRAVLVGALTAGYLSELEAAYQEKRVADYYLLPGHKLAKGKAPATRTRPVALSGLYLMWEKLEALAGVEHLRGRCWYGMRRLQSDLAEDVEDDARVLNKLGGWSHTATREGYQERGRLDIAQRAAETRRKIRPRNELTTTQDAEPGSASYTRKLHPDESAGVSRSPK